MKENPVRSQKAPAKTLGADVDSLRSAVRSRYAAIAESALANAENGGCCGGSGGCETSCDSGTCGDSAREGARTALLLGYTESDLSSDAAEANLGLGCGNPVAISSLKPGERVVDLGSGAGFDCFLAARAVGSTGQVIGVDMTSEMIARARAIGHRRGMVNVEFRLGEIEHLPVADESVDVVISNCVINLSPDKKAVFREAYRVLAKGGRFAVADVVAVREMPTQVREDVAAYAECIAGAVSVDDLRRLLEEAGFGDVRIEIPVPAVTPGATGAEEMRSGWTAPALVSARKGS